jgi:peroxiredoxin Q/BCP
MSKHPLLGQTAPTLSLPNADGTTYEFKPGASGKPAAVFFYPKAGAFSGQFVTLVSYRGDHTDTYGCTKEVCGFRDAMNGTLRRRARTHDNRDVVTNWFTEQVDFKDSGITLVGISGDPVPAIKAFSEKYSVTVRV